MNKYFITFIYLISISLCGYLPLKKENGFDNKVCAYHYSSVSYVQTCKDKGKYCKYIGEQTSFCENVPAEITLKTLDETCTSKYECEKGLNCFGKCTKATSASISTKCDNANEEPHRTKNGWICKISSIADYCSYKDNNVYTSSVDYEPDYSKVCGEITFEQQSLGSQGTQYNVLTVKSAYIGTVPDGKFVLNVKACKSGYALPFYPDSSSDKDPSTINSNKKYLKCVNLNEIDYKDTKDCILKYDTDKLYDASRISYSSIASGSIGLSGNLIYDSTGFYNGQYGNYNDEFCDEKLITKLDMFSKYIGVFTEEKQSNCAKKENYNEPDTCNDNELRKWFYYYNNPEHYVLYYKEDGNDVANYLIQRYYPLYESSKFIYMKYLINILFLLLFF